MDLSKLLGFISEPNRTADQHRAHHEAVGKMKAYALPCPTLAKGESVRLFDFWKNERVVKDVGFVFTRFHQLTGSCVGAGGGNGLFSTIAAQCVAGKTKAFLPFWLSAYAMSRHYMGDDGQGEGSLGSTFAKALEQDGITDWPNGMDPDDLPDYTQPDGIVLTERIEMQWSSYRNPALGKILPKTRLHLLGSATEARDVQNIRALLLNGYGVTFACDRYIGNGSIASGGGTPYVRGKWDGSGGHQQSLHAFWEHPNDGPLYWAQNNWPGSTYPKDPAGGPTCGVWVAESDVAAALRYHAEVFGLSNQAWFQPNPEIMQWVF